MEIRLYHYLDNELLKHCNLVLEVLSKFGRLVSKWRAINPFSIDEVSWSRI